MYNDIETLNMIKTLANEIDKQNGRSYFVGGFVRDKFLGIDNKDYDIEVHGLEKEKLEEIIENLGTCLKFGKSFGVYNIKGYGVDIALPRTEIKNGARHQDFLVDVDPYIGEEKAASRRDFTINALMENVITHEIKDYFNGINDLNNKIIKHIDDEKFSEDPLRVLRACQFAARFNFTIDKSTLELCKSIDINNLSKERIYGELSKALLKSNKPSIFFNYLREMDHLNEWFPELYNLIGVNQRQDYHQEGDVWNHTMMVLDEGAKHRNLVNNKLAFMLSCLCHDLGKSECSVEINGVIHSHNHDIAGIKIANKFLKHFTNDKKIIKYVLNMVKLHMKPNMYAENNSSMKATNTMFYNSVDPNDLIILSVCDNLGKISIYEHKDNTKYLYDRLAIFNEIMAKPYITGDDLIANGITPSTDFTKLLKQATNLRLSGLTKEKALKQILGEYKNNK